MPSETPEDDFDDFTPVVAPPSSGQSINDPVYAFTLFHIYVPPVFVAPLQPGPIPAPELRDYIMDIHSTTRSLISRSKFTQFYPVSPEAPSMEDQAYFFNPFYQYEPVPITRPEQPGPLPSTLVPSAEELGHNLTAWFRMIVGWDVLAGNTKRAEIVPGAPIPLP